MDSMSSLLWMHSTASWFTIYEREDDDPEHISVPARIFQRVLSTYRPDQNIEISIDGDDSKLMMDFKGGEKTCDKYSNFL